MTSQVFMDDGSESPLIDHLRDEHKKGTRGYTDEYLESMHTGLHRRARDPLPEHQHLGDGDDDDDGLGGDRELINA